MISDEPAMNISTPTDETLDLLFDYGRGQAASQRARADVLDAKGMQLFAAGSVVVGLSGLGGEAGNAVVTGTLMVAFGAYFALAVAAFLMLRVRSWRVTGHADVLWAEHWQDSPRDIKHAIVAETADAVVENRAGLNAKAMWLKVTHVLLSIEVVSVSVAVLASRLG